MSEADGLAIGFMMMQELMLAVETAKAYPESIVFIDGSKVTFIIKINQFYMAFWDENKKEQLDLWRSPKNTSDAGRVLQAFEGQNWLADFIGLPNIVGLPKLVTTDLFARQYLPDKYKGRFDDKVLAALVLKRGERTRTIYLPNPEAERLKDKNADVAPYHISKDYFPHARDFETISKLMTTKGSLHRVSHCYFNAPANGAIYKVERTDALGGDALDNVLRWLTSQSCSPDMLEPYSMYVVDRFVSEAVALSRKATFEITRSKSTSEWAWSLTGSYRST